MDPTPIFDEPITSKELARKAHLVMTESFGKEGVIVKVKLTSNKFDPKEQELLEAWDHFSVHRYLEQNHKKEKLHLKVFEIVS